MREAVIVSGARTAVGNFGGSLKDIPLVKIGAVAIREVLKKAGLKPTLGKEILEMAPDVFKGDRADRVWKSPTPNGKGQNRRFRSTK